jgi:hypothetical protein
MCNMESTASWAMDAGSRLLRLLIHDERSQSFVVALICR